MPNSNQDHFQEMYAGVPPWEIGRPQQVFREIAPNVTGSVLDVGCGTGENSLLFASRGHRVTGIDFLEEPIRRAIQKANDRKLPATFLVMNALHLHDLPEEFDSIIDSGLFHVFNDEDRQRYVSGLLSVTRTGGRVYLICFSDAEPGEQGPRRVSQAEIEQTFSGSWEIELLTRSQFEVRPGITDMTFSDGGPRAWFLQARKRC